MKRTLLTVAFAITITTLSFTQEDHFGVKSGANITTIKFSNGIKSMTPDRAIKLHFGLYFNKMISDKLAFQPEAFFSTVGYKPQASSPIDNISLTYLAFPLMLKYYVKRTFNLHAGPQFSRLIYASEYMGVSLASETKSFEFAFGIGAELKIERYIDLSFRYVGGANTDDTGSSDIQKSSTYQLSVLLIIDNR